LLLLTGEALQNAGPRGFGAFMQTFGQTVFAGAALAVIFTAFALVIPSLTDRRAFASAGGVLLIIGSAAISNVFAFGLRLGDGWLLLGLERLPFEVTLRIFDRHGLPTPSGRPLPTAAVAGAATAATLVAASVTWWRVVHAEVTR
jgi:hypothetical protein